MWATTISYEAHCTLTIFDFFAAFDGDETRHTKYLGVEQDDKSNQTHIFYPINSLDNVTTKEFSKKKKEKTNSIKNE